MTKKRSKPTGLPAIRIAPVHLPEFGLDVSWAMCRNPMCENFGIHFEGKIPAGKKQVTDDHYAVRITPSGARGRLVAEIHCRACGLTPRLPSNHAVRPSPAISCR